MPSMPDIKLTRTDEYLNSIRITNYISVSKKKGRKTNKYICAQQFGDAKRVLYEWNEVGLKWGSIKCISWFD